MRVIVSLTAAVSALALSACQPEPAEAPASGTDAPAPSADPNAVTSRGWTVLRIGMTLEEVEQALGADSDPEAVGGPEPEACDMFRPERAPEGLMVMIERGRLTRISLHDGSELETDAGFSVGDEAAEIKAHYGAQAVSTPHKYVEAPAEYITVWTAGDLSGDYVQDPEARGIVYEIGQDGRVQMIHAGGPSIQYVEGCA